jgi:siroheme synthase
VGIPLTFRGVARSFAVVTGQCRRGEETNWADFGAIDTLVILMGVKERAEIAARLLDAGRKASEPAAFIERGTTPEERVITTTLGEVAAGAIAVEAPAVFVVGEVVRVREELLECASVSWRAEAAR